MKITQATALHPGPEPHHVLCPRNHCGCGSVCRWHHAQQIYRGTAGHRWVQMSKRGHELCLIMSSWSENRIGYIQRSILFPSFRYFCIRPMFPYESHMNPISFYPSKFPIHPILTLPDVCGHHLLPLSPAVWGTGFGVGARHQPRMWFRGHWLMRK